MHKFLVTFIIIIGITVTSCSGDNKNESKTQKTTTKSQTEQKAVWMSFDEGLAKAASEKKNMIVDFYTDWCHWCKVMDEKTFSDEKVNKKLVEKFITVRIDAEDRAKTATYKGKTFNNIELTQAFGVRGFPSLGFIDSQGEVITVVPGYIPADTFLYLLQYIEEECYKKQMPFDEYMKKKGECDEEAKNK